MNPDLSRRRFIHFVGRAGGAAAAYRTMAAMGLLPAPSAYAGPPALPPGNGTPILILAIGLHSVCGYAGGFIGPLGVGLVLDLAGNANG